jgi:hypothetical protein
MTTINQPPIRLPDLADTNDRQADLRQIRQQVADRVGVSTQQVELEFVGGDLQARILPEEGGETSVSTVCLEFTDTKDLQRVKAYSTSPIDQLVSFGAGDGKGPIAVGRLMPQTAGSGRAYERDTLVPRLQAFLSREFMVPADQIELKWEPQTKGGFGLSARRTGATDWQPLEFVNNDEREVLVNAARDVSDAKNNTAAGTTTPTVTTETTGTAVSPSKTGGTFPLSQLSTAVRQGETRSVTLPALIGSRDERLLNVKQQLSAQLGVPPERILLRETGGQLRAAIIPQSLIGASMKRLTEAWRPEQAIVIQTASPTDSSWLTSEVRQSASNLLHQLGVRSENPNAITIPRIPTDMGRDTAITAFKDEIKRVLGTSDQNIDIRFNDQGILQAQVSGNSKVWDVRIPDSYTREWLLGVARENPTERLSTFGERRLTNQADLGFSTGYPNTEGATTFGQSLSTRYNSGQWYIGGGVRLSEGLDGSIHDSSRDGHFTLQEGRLEMGHREYLGFGVKYSYKPDGGGISVDGISSNFATHKLQRFGEDLKDFKPYALLTTLGVLAAAGGVGYALSRRDEVTKLNAPIDGTIIDSGHFKLTAGVNGDVLLGGAKGIDYTFKGAKMGFRENIASGTVANQRFEYKHDHDNTQGGNLLNGQFDGTIAYRTGYNLRTSYNTSTGKFVDSRLDLSQSFQLSRGMGMNVGVGGSLNGQGKLHDPTFQTGWSYQRGDAWNFRANIGTTQDINGQWRGFASAGVSVNF